MAIPDLIPIVSAVVGQAARGFPFIIASFELGKIDRLVIFYHKCLTVPMFTDLSLTPGSHTVRSLGKDATNCLLSESAHLMEGSILQEGSENACCRVKTYTDKYRFFFMKGKLNHLVTKYVPLANWGKKGFSSYVIIHSCVLSILC